MSTMACVRNRHETAAALSRDVTLDGRLDGVTVASRRVDAIDATSS